MHTSPTQGEQLLFLKQNRLTIYLFSLASTSLIITGNIFFLKTFPQLWPYAVVIGITVFYLAMSYVVGLMGRGFDSVAHDKLISKYITESEHASIDIFLPVCREPFDLIKNTWDHVKKLIMAHSRVNIYVLDDGNDMNLRTLAKVYGYKYIARQTNELKKAGNLRNAFAQTGGEFILILDADFCPSPNILINTLPYFFNDPNVSIVQTPQFFDVKPEYGWVRRGAGAVQELFYRLIQVNRNSFNGAICVGTNAVYRRKHLEPFGGTAPVPYSEDVHTGFQLIASGYKIIYIPINLALGACPDTLKQFFTQQYRWSLGSISLLFSKKFWAAKLPFMQRICYMSGMFFYISTGIGTVTAFIPGLIMLIYYPQHIHWYNLLFAVPSLLFTVIFMKLWMKLPMNFDVLRVRAVSYFAHLFALKDFLLGTLEEWKATGAEFKSDRYITFKWLYCGINILILTATFFLIGYRIARGSNPLDFSLVILFTLFNGFVTIPVIKDL